MSISPFIPLGIALVTLRCNPLPRLDIPARTVQSAWPQSAPAGGPLASTLDWRKFLTDPALQEVIELGLEHNLDLRVAALQVERAQASVRIRSLKAEALNPYLSTEQAQQAARISLVARSQTESVLVELQRLQSRWPRIAMPRKCWSALLCRTVCSRFLRGLRRA